jgi:type II secretory pathway component PulJ
MPQLRLTSHERALSAAEPRRERAIWRTLASLDRRYFRIELCRREQPRPNSSERNFNHQPLICRVRLARCTV